VTEGNFDYFAISVYFGNKVPTERFLDVSIELKEGT
jgi:hypothetical protein